MLLVLCTITGRSQAGDDACHTGALYPDSLSILKIPYEHPFALPKGTRLPERVDLSPWFPPAGYQGRRNSCTGWAVGYALKAYQERSTVAKDRKRGASPVGGDTMFSPAFVYDYIIQHVSGSADCDQGSDLVHAISVAVELGVCSWNDMPYDTASKACLDPIAPEALSRARRYVMESPMALDVANAEQWRYHLSDGRPVVFGLNIDRGFLTAGRAAAKGSGEFVWQGVDTTLADWAIDGHALVCAGYDATDSTYLVLNSWGQDWGRKGWCRIPWAVMARWAYVAYVVDRFDEQAATCPDRGHVKVLEASDHRIEERIREGRSVEVGGLLLRCTRISGREDEMRFELREAGYGGRLLKRATAREDLPANFHLQGAHWVFTFEGTGPFGGRARFTLSREADTADAFITNTLARIAECQRH